MEAETPKKPGRYGLWWRLPSRCSPLSPSISRQIRRCTIWIIPSRSLRHCCAAISDLREKPPEWLNEMIPYRNRYYSAFPLGAVFSMVPVALLQKASLIHDFPARILAASSPGACVYFFFQLAKAFGPDYSSRKPKPLARRILLALFPVFGTWTWCNLGMGGAWQIALGLALLGETAALYFTLVRPSPFIARGVLHSCFWKSDRAPPYSTFLPLSFLAPARVCRGGASPAGARQPERLPYNVWIVSSSGSDAPDGAAVLWKNFKRALRLNAPMAFDFLILPVTLALLTGAYNLARFHSIADFGYFHIPEVRDEPWYTHGLFRSSRFRGTSTK